MVFFCLIIDSCSTEEIIFFLYPFKAKLFASVAPEVNTIFFGTQFINKAILCLANSKIFFILLPFVWIEEGFP